MRTQFQLIGIWIIALAFSTMGWGQANDPFQEESKGQMIVQQGSEKYSTLGQDIKLLINLAEAYRSGYLHEVLTPSIKIQAGNTADNVREDPLPTKKLESLNIEDYNIWTQEVETFTFIEIDYQENLLPASILSSWRVAPDAPWEPSVKIEFLYDEFGRKISEIVSIWDVYTDSWDGIYKVTYEYPVPGKLNITEFDAEAAYWAPSWREEMEIDEQGKVLNSQLYHWNSVMAHWHITLRSEMEYDVSGKLLYENTFLWDTERIKWKLMSIMEYRYGYNDELLEQLFIEVDEDHGIYFTEWKYVFQYLANGKKYSNTYLYWDGVLQKWNNSARVSYNYDPSGALVTTTYQYWDITRPGWVNQERDNYQVFHAYAFEDAIVTDFISDMFFGERDDFPYLVERIFVDAYNEMNEEWSVESSLTFKYADIGTANQSYDALNASVYPNPTDGILFIETDQECHLNIYDANGREVYYRVVDPSRSTLYLDNLENGLYYLVLRNDDGSTTRKLMLQR